MKSPIELSEYDIQANDFAAKYGVSLSVLSHRFGSMSWDKDGQKRNIFKLKLARGHESYTFEFGSSVSDSCEPTVLNKWDQLKETDHFEVYCGIKHTKLGYVSRKFSLTKGDASCVSDEQIKNWSNEFYNEMELSVKLYNSKNRRIDHLTNDSKYRTESLVRNAIERTIKKLQSENITVYLNQKKEVVSPSMYDVLACLTKYDPGSFENFCGDFGYDTDSRTVLKTYKAVVKEWKAIDSMLSDVIDELQEIQ